MKQKDVEALTAGQDEAVAAAQRYVQGIFDIASSMDADTQKQLLLNALPSIAIQFGQVAAEKAARWYEAQRRKALGETEWTASTVPLGDEFEARIRNGVTAVAGGLYGRDGSIEAVKEPVNTIVDSAVRSASRQTVERNIARDPSKPQLRRFAEPGACPFCIAVCSDMNIYSDDSGFHDHCRCQSVPAWGNKKDDIASRANECYDAYMSAQRELAKENPNSDHSPSAKATINYMRRNGVTI